MKVLTIIMGVLVTIGGFFCMFTPGATFLTLGWLVGILVTVAGINIIAAYVAARKAGASSAWDLVSGILTTVVGLMLIFNNFMQLFTDVMIIYFFAGMLIVTGIFRVVAALKLKKAAQSWVFILVIGIITVLLGCYSFIHPVFTAVTIGFLMGFWVIQSGINLIIVATAMDK